LKNAKRPKNKPKDPQWTKTRKKQEEEEFENERKILLQHIIKSYNLNFCCWATFISYEIKTSAGNQKTSQKNPAKRLH